MKQGSTLLMRAMLPKAGFSSFSRVQGGSITLSSHYPPKLRIPIDDKVSYDVSIPEGEGTLKDFEEQVKKDCSKHVRAF